MKERTKGFLAGVLVSLLVVVLAVPALASVYDKAVQIYYRDIKVTLNGKTITPKDAQGNPVEPFLMNGTTYLPIRGISSALGLDVQWDQGTYTVGLTTEDYQAPDGGFSKLDRTKVWSHDYTSTINGHKENYRTSVAFLSDGTCLGMFFIPNSGVVSLFQGTYRMSGATMTLSIRWNDLPGQVSQARYEVSVGDNGRLSMTKRSGDGITATDEPAGPLAFYPDSSRTIAQLQQYVDTGWNTGIA
ncbi:MAG TPA: copper amine oxidase N-terminal domain-containing protein [Candidatus Evtepia faecigallinarum]|nr:copper amine oxidase N-terminal domain-containing protein [Candidatus Evtepia faecigallinarum]